jgi:glutathione S-transferase
MRARMALDVSGVEIEHREVLLRDKPAAMLTASPKGTVPVLVTDTGVIDESLDVMIWALSQNDPENWLADSEQDQLDVESFLNSFKEQLDRYKYASRYDPSVPRGDVDLKQRVLAMATLTQFTASLENTPYLRGDSPRLIDIAAFPFVRQFAAVQPNWWNDAAPQSLSLWLSDWLQSDRFKRIMFKYSVWKEV